MLCNTIYPEVGIACYKLLDYYGVDVEYPLLQTCCGQSVDNEEMAEEKAGLLGRLDRLFDEYEYVVGPSGYCASFLKSQHACRIGKKIYDIILKVDEIPGIFPFKVSVHNCCHGTSEEHSFLITLIIPRLMPCCH